MKKLLHLISVLMTVAIVTTLVSCSDDNNDGEGCPVITGVRITDPKYADSLFTESPAGQTIVILGQNLGSTYELYINDQKVSLIGTFITDNNIIVTVPEKIELSGINPELSDEIKVVTRNGVATYGFHITAPWCYVKEMTADYPLNEGDFITLTGENFIDIDSIKFVENLPYDFLDESLEWWEKEDVPIVIDPDNVEIAITDYQVDNDFKELKFRLPEGMTDEGYVIIWARRNPLYVRIFRNASIAVVSGVNSDMPVLGSTVRIYGSGFIGIISVIIGDDEIVIPEYDLTISKEGDCIEFTMPELPVKGSELTVVNVAGKTKIPFYDTTYMLCDLDNKGGINWGGAFWVEGDGVNPPMVTSGWCAGVKTDIQGPTGWWNDGRMGFREMPIPVDIIPADMPVERMEFRYEGYFMSTFEKTNVMFAFGENGLNAITKPQSLIDDEIKLNEWATYHIAMSLLVGDAKTWGEVCSQLAWPEFVIHAMSMDVEGTEHIEFYVDNLRIYIKPDNK